MPEIGEIARIVHYLRKHLVGRTIHTCEAFADDIVYGKVGCSANAFQSAVQGRRVTGAAQQGKYFYMTFDRPPHAVMHFGMTGWMKFDVEDTEYYKKAKEKEGGEETAEWPPKYAKFLLKCEAEKVGGEERQAVEAAFVDPRRLARIRLVECAEAEIRQHSPLKENGPDPVRDKDVVTVEWLGELLGRKRVPVKALLLDQANLSGVGNWVADEVLYQARIHPEQYSNTFDEEQIKRLHDALIGVCTLAVETLADSKQFPETWLMKYRWDKGKKDANVLPNGEKIVHLKVGGRTSAVVPSVQKKTAAVAGDVESDDEGGKVRKPAKGQKRKAKNGEEEEHGAADVKPVAKKGRSGKKARDADVEVGEEAETKPAVRSGRGAKRTNYAEVDSDVEMEEKPAATKKGRGGRKAKAEPTDEEDVEEAPSKKAAPKKARAGKKAKTAAADETDKTIEASAEVEGLEIEMADLKEESLPNHTTGEKLKEDAGAAKKSIAKQGRGGGRKAKAQAADEEAVDEEQPPQIKKGRGGKRAKPEETDADGGAEQEAEAEAEAEEVAGKGSAVAKLQRNKATKKAEKPVVPGERKSARTRTG